MAVERDDERKTVAPGDGQCLDRAGAEVRVDEVAGCGAGPRRTRRRGRGVTTPPPGTVGFRCGRRAPGQGARRDRGRRGRARGSGVRSAAGSRGGRAFQAELQTGDLSRIEVDVAQQIAGGADMLDVNVGDPLADEIELMRKAIPLVQSLTDLPLCIDSSVIEALEAGLGAYQGKALVNSVTGEDERLEAILPIVAKHGAAVIGLANDDEIPMEPQRRLEVARKIVSAAGDHGIPPEDVLIDPLAMPVGAEPRAVTLFLETVRLIRDELGVNMTCGASNTSFGLPGRETLGASVPRRRREPRPDERDHGRALAGDRRRRPRDRLPARPRRVGRGLDRGVSQEAGGPRVVIDAVVDEMHPDRVRLVFQQADGATKEARVPAGTTLFDCASWNGVAIDSTCGGHGTCKKCKVRVASGRQELSSVDPRAFSPDELKAGLAARLPRAGGGRTSWSRCRCCRRGRRLRSPASGGT